MEDLTGKQLGPYQVVAPLGEGGMAAVYKAYQPGMDRYVALKILPRKLAEDPKFVGRFKQEAKVLAKLQHPHILPVFDFGEADGYTYIVMPFVESGTLADLLRGQPLPLKQIRSIISQIGGALHYAHTHGLVHRDVKPSNVLVDESGNCLLTDFGIAKMVEGTAKFTSTGGVIGTPAYMSPEQGRGDKLDGRSDIYSLGIMLFEMATGRVPFNAETPVAIIFKHISDPLPMPRTLNPNLPESMERVILKSLAKNPEERFQKAEVFVEALTAALPEGRRYDSGAETIREAISEMPPLPLGEPVKRRRAIPGWGWWVVGGLIVAIVGVGVGAALLIPQALPAASPTPAGTEQDIMVALLTQGAATEIAARTPWAATQAAIAKTPSRTPGPTRTPLPTATDIPVGTVLFEEDFEDEKAQLFDHWHGGTWTIVADSEGNKVYEIDNASALYPEIAFGSPSWANYKAEYRFKILEFQGGAPAIQLQFRDSADGMTNYIQAILPAYREIIVAVDPGWRRLQTRTFNFTVGLWYSVRVEVQGTQIRVFADDALVIDVADSQIDSGKLVISVGPGTHAQFDDIRVTALRK